MVKQPAISDRRRNKKQLVANIVLAALSLGVSLVVVELALRTIIPLDPRRPFEFRIPHPVFGWALQPNASYLFQAPEGSVSVAYNSQGWRDTEHLKKKPDGVFRILVLGDSFMEAASIELADTFHKRVEEFARATGQNVEVISMGVAGYGTLQEYLVYRDVGQLYEPDLVLVGFYDGNDLVNNSLELASSLPEEGTVTTARPFLALDESSHWTITPVAFEDAQRAYDENLASLEAKRNSLTEKLILFRLFRAGLDRIPLPDFLTGPEIQPEPVDKERQEMVLMGVNYCLEPAEYTRAWDITERILAMFKEEVEAHGSKLVVFDVPAEEEVSLEYMEAVIADVAHPEKLCLEDAPGHARLNQILTELDVEQISLLADFRRVMREDGVNLYQSDLHWSPKGHALAAEIVVSELIRGQLLPISDR